MRKIYQKKNLDGKTRVRRYFGGFTLIELLVVVLIIGILAAVAVPQYQRVVRHAQMSQIFTYLNGLKKAQEMYFMANGNYTYRFDELDWQFPCEYLLHDDGSTESYLALNDKCYFGDSFGGANIGVSGGFRITQNTVNAWIWWGANHANTILCYQGLENAPKTSAYYSQHPSKIVCTVRESNQTTQGILKSMGGKYVGALSGGDCGGGGTGACLQYEMQ